MKISPGQIALIILVLVGACCATVIDFAKNQPPSEVVWVEMNTEIARLIPKYEGGEFAAVDLNTKRAVSPHIFEYTGKLITVVIEGELVENCKEVRRYGAIESSPYYIDLTCLEGGSTK